MMLIGLLVTFILLSVCIVIHELGHMVVMLRNGVKVLEFSFGFGKPLWQHTAKSGITYSWRSFPLGGFVKPVDKGPESVKAQRPWVQFKILMAGMFVNATASFIVLLALFFGTGKMPVVVLEFAHKVPMPGWLFMIAVAFVGSYGLWLVTPPLVCVMLVKMGIGFFKTSAGPIGIMAMGAAIVTQSPTVMDAVIGLAFYFAIINSSVAGFNLMPLVGLDGGHIFELLLEKVFGKRSATVIGWYRTVTVVMLLLLIGGILFFDFLRLLPKSLADWFGA